MTFEAVLLIGAVLALTDWVKSLVGDSLPSRATPLLAMAIAVAAVFLVGESDWAHSQIVNDLPLDTLNTASKLLAGVFLGTGAMVGDKVLNAVRNVGQNQGSRSPSE